MLTIGFNLIFLINYKKENYWQDKNEEVFKTEEKDYIENISIENILQETNIQARKICKT